MFAEYGYTLKVDQKSDIYSYGVVLMETEGSSTAAAVSTQPTDSSESGACSMAAAPDRASCSSDGSSRQLSARKAGAEVAGLVMRLRSTLHELRLD